MAVILPFLNTNSGSIQAVSTVILVLITIYYSWQTRKAVKEAANTRKDSRLPIIEPTEMNGPITGYAIAGGPNKRLQLDVKNIGYGLAINIYLIIPNQGPIKIRNFAEGQEGGLAIPIKEDEIKKLTDLSKSDKIMHIEYEDIFGRKITTVISFEVKIMDNGSQAPWPVFSVDDWELIMPK